MIRLRLLSGGGFELETEAEHPDQLRDQVQPLVQLLHELQPRLPKPARRCRCGTELERTRPNTNGNVFLRCPLWRWHDGNPNDDQHDSIPLTRNGGQQQPRPRPQQDQWTAPGGPTYGTGQPPPHQDPWAGQQAQGWPPPEEPSW